MTIIEFPRRISPIAPRGTLLKCTSAQPRAHRPDEREDSDHLALVRQCPCLKCGLDGFSEACHVRFASAAFGKASGLQKKPADRWAVPLDAACHRLARDAQHKRNEQEFWASLNIPVLQVCKLLYGNRGDLPAMRATIFLAIMGRGA